MFCVLCCSFYFQIGKGHNGSKHQSIQLKWNYVCPWCGCKHLNTSTAAFKNKCCLRGTSEDKMPALRPLDGIFLDVVRDQYETFNPQATTINNILSMGSTGIANSHGGGWEGDMHGPHCLKLNGRSYHLMQNVTTAPSRKFELLRLSEGNVFVMNLTSAPYMTVMCIQVV
jgi:hypothetical protein